MSDKQDHLNEGGERSGFGIVEADEKHLTGKTKKPEALGKNYGQGVGYGGYSVEQDQGKSQTGTPDHVKKETKTGE